MESTIEELGKELISAVEIVMNETATREQRLRANGFCENFKETSPHCVECGLYLSTINNSPMIRHIGLQLIEHRIKNRWNDLNLHEKQFIRKNAMSLLVSGTNHMLAEPVYIKNAVTKIVVEIIKQQWPQEWPTLIDELCEAGDFGETQTELVLLIYLRLAEDTITLQNIPKHRQRGLIQALHNKLSYIIYYSNQLLFKHSEKFKLLNANDPFDEQTLIHCQMTKTILELFTYFAEWISFTHLWSNLKILPSICPLLNAENLQLEAVECLFSFVGRKGTIAERRPHLLLFTEQCMKPIYKAAISKSSNPVDEHHYTFLKRLCGVLVGIGNQLLVMWGTCGIKRPENFEIYLNALFAFTNHPGQMLNDLTLVLWASFLRHEHISQDSIFLSFVPHIAKVLRLKLMKVGSRSRNNHLSCQYSIFDFDNNEDFNKFFTKYRSRNTDILRLAAALCPMKIFDLAAKWLRQQLTRPVNSSSILEWETLAIYLDAICSKVIQTDNKPKPSVQQGIILLQSVLHHETNDPNILCHMLSCISALINFLTQSSEALPAVLEKLFSAMTFSLPDRTKSTNVRHHACASLVNICKHYPALLVSSFEQIHRRVDVLSDDPNPMSLKERSLLYEALILINNQFNNYQQQASFFEKYLNPVKKIWLSQEITDALSTTETLMHYVGLTHAPGDKDEDTFESNRNRIFYCVSTILGVIKRAKWPEDPNTAVRGGFLRPYEASGCSNDVLCNPATPFVLTFFENLFKLIRSLNNLWLPEARALLAAEYQGAYDLWDVDKVNVPLDETDAIETKQPLERMQDFICRVHDNCYHILGNAGPNLMHEFFVMPGLGDHIVSDVMCNIDLIPDHKLRTIIRDFIQSFVRSCPPDCYETILVPVLIKFCPFVFQRLNSKWLQPNDEIKDAVESSDEIEDQVLYEYYLFLGAMLYVKRNTSNDSTMDATSDDNLNFVSQLGQLVLKHDELRSSIVSCCFHALAWRNSQICIKILSLCNAVFKHLVASDTLSGEEAKEIIMCILMGLHVHDQHEVNQGSLFTLAFQAYEILRPLHPEVSSLLREIPDCPMQVLQSFENMLLQKEARQAEKNRKEMFKKIVGSFLGKHIGQLHSKPVRQLRLEPQNPSGQKFPPKKRFRKPRRRNNLRGK
uniref:Importin N-terminal domain-containing protein n=1 Tax=Strigamia maritima TaxID=126957 RepID=T1J6B5_STRMM